MKFRVLSGDINWKEFGGEFVSKRLNNGEWNYWLVLKVINMHEATGDEKQPKYHLDICAISPEAAGKENLAKALNSCGFGEDEVNKMSSKEFNKDLIHVSVLSEYGTFAALHKMDGNNINSLLKEAKKLSDQIEMLFGFWMDKPENRIGQSGWDLISGQDIREFLGVK